VYAQICIDFKSKCVSINAFDENGKKVKEVRNCSTDLIEVSGVIRIPISEHKVKDYVCFLADEVQLSIEFKGSILKIK
jgi:hypothetical protein